MSTNPNQAPALGEKIANAVSHGVGFLALLIASPFLIVAAVQSGSVYAIVGTSVFAATAMLLYFASSVYHALPEGRAKRVFMNLDYSAIYLLIAGSYTPFMIGVLRGPLGWTLLGIIWAMAIFGIVSRVTGALRCPKITTLLYLGMGWLALFAIVELWRAGAGMGFFWLVAGGVAYTVGVIFFAKDRIRFFHLVWHLFVLLGTACHFLAIYHYSI